MKILSFSRLAILVLLVFGLYSCSNTPNIPENDPGFIDYISAHTGGVISSYSHIEVHLREDVNPGVEPGTPVEADLFSFSPNIEGVAQWKSSNSIEFIPTERLEPGEQYTGTFRLHSLMDVPSNLKEFEFAFQAMERGYNFVNFKMEPYSSSDLVWNKITGTINSNDQTSPDELAEYLDLEGVDENQIQYINTGNGNVYQLLIDSVRRTDEAENIVLSFNGQELAQMRVPGLGEFEVLNVSVTQGTEQSVSISFSDPLSANQQTNGLFRLGGTDVTSVTIEGSVVKLFPNRRLNGNVQLVISEGLKNVLGYSFPKTYTTHVAFNERNPEIEFVNDGNIIPTSGRVQIPFRAVGLKAVDVRIYKVFADNVHQFLQVNDYAGNRELKRVARPVHQERVDLTGNNVNYSDWTNFSIDLDQMIRRDPGAIYRVELSFRRSYAIFPCENQDEIQNELVTQDENWDQPENQTYYDYYEEDYYYDYYYPPGYDYRQRDNPCHTSYYTRNRNIAKNVFATDLAIILKGNRGKYTAFVHSLTSAEPVSGVDITLYNYQGQKIKSESTDGDGAAHFNIDGVPFLAMAQLGDERAYLTLEPGKSLSISSYDVSGYDMSNGIQAFMYGERGVWRPGDTIFLDAILSDIDNPLPASHPIVLSVDDAEGKEVFRKVVSRGTKSIYSFQIVTDKSAGTGTYSAKLEVGGKKFYKSLQVETIQPNRFDISVSTPGNVIEGASNPTVSLDAEWLTGANAGGMKVQMEGSISVKHNPFEGYEDFDFEDDVKRAPVVSQKEIFEGYTDGSGHVSVNPDLGYLKSSPGMLNLTISSKVYEPSGRFSINTTRIPLAPYDHFVGVKMPEGNAYGYLETGKTHNVSIARVDARGRPASGTVTVKVYKVKWSWWWSAQRGEATYLNREYSTVISQGSVTLNESGRGVYKMNVNDEQWGRVYVVVEDPNSGHSTSAFGYLDWPWGRDRSGRPGDEAVSGLNILLNKQKYAPGEQAEITIPTAQGGQILLTVEDGNHIVSEHHLDATDGQTVFKLPITPEMAPNVYVYAMVMQPHSQTQNDRPIRMYGVVPLMVEDPLTVLKPVIAAPETVRPNAPYAITVSEENGQRMEYTLAVVDEGLLGITNFKTPDPWSYFYAKRALGVRTWDFYDMVVGAFGGQIARVLAVGGDGLLLPENEEDADRFVPVVRHIGPFVLESGTSKTHQFNMPNYIGNVRVMVVAANKKEAFGSSSANIVVKQPLMAQLTMPRVLGPGESPKIPVTLFVLDESIRQVQVKLETDGPLSVSGGTRTVNFNGEGQKTIYFDGSVAEVLGLAHVRLVAKGGREESRDEIEISVRSPMLRQTREEMFAIQTGEKSVVAEPFGLRGGNDLIVEVSSLPSMNLEQRLNYLIGYPHGCLEQTTSKSFAQLNLDKWVQMTDEQKIEIQNNVNAGLKKLRSMQFANGGFRYWPNADGPASWASTYAGHFIISAERSGYVLPAGLKDNYLRYESEQARSWNGGGDYYRRNNDLNQAYRLYVLALAGKPEVGAMNRLRNRSTLTMHAARRLAAAFAINGNTDVARELLLKSWSEPDSRYWYYCYGGNALAKAIELEAQFDMGNEAEALRLARELIGDMEHGYYNTHTLAYSLQVLSKVFNGQTDHLEATVEINGVQHEVNTDAATEQFRIDDFERPMPVAVENNGDGPIYVSVVRSGVPRFGSETASEKRINMQVRYKDEDGNALDVSRLKIGETIIAEVTLNRTSGSKDYENLALTQIFPSGWEISNDRITGVTANSTGGYDYRDIRDDRVMTYFTMEHRGSITFRVELTATYPGRWYLPPSKVEAMYDLTIEATNVGQWVEVVTE